jgi:hypothetical protein
MNQLFQHFMRDCVYELVEKARTAKAAMDTTKSDYDAGKLMAFCDVISMLQQQARSFEIPLDTIGLGDINPDVDLL